MIVYEYYGIDTSGRDINRIYSDLGVYIECEGKRYKEAFEPEGSSKVYTETDIPSTDTENDVINEIVKELKG